MKFKFNSRATPDTELNLIPLLDVLLVVLIFFMVESTFEKQQGVVVELPSAKTDHQPKGKLDLIVNITSNGNYHIQGQPVPPERVADLLRSISQGRDMEIICRADKNAKHQHVINFMKLVGDAGFSKISFATMDP